MRLNSDVSTSADRDDQHLGEGTIVPKFPTKSALTLLEARILLVDDQALALADNDLAVTGTALDA
jgi:hypothetical protein